MKKKQHMTKESFTEKKETIFVLPQSDLYDLYGANLNTAQDYVKTREYPFNLER